MPEPLGSCRAQSKIIGARYGVDLDEDIAAFTKMDQVFTLFGTEHIALRNWAVRPRLRSRTCLASSAPFADIQKRISQKLLGWSRAMAPGIMLSGEVPKPWNPRCCIL
jgi:hypothetical protein